MKDFKKFMRDNYCNIDDRDVQGYLRGLVQFYVNETKERNMDYQKKYKNLINKLQGLIDNGEKQGHIIIGIEDIESAIPELKESENEKIRKEICKILWENAPYEEAQKYINYICKKQVSTNSKEYEEMKETCLFYLNKQKCYVNDVSYIEKCISWLEEQYEQEEPQVYETNDGEVITYSETNGYGVVEAKFHEGEWIIFTRKDGTREVLQVSGIIDDRYYFNHSLQFSWSIKECNEKCHLWTIADAKNGDVLATDDWVFIFEKLNTEGKPVCYCHYDVELGFAISINTYISSDSYIRPATKEQRDALVKAIDDAGYIFDFEKKELKKIEQKPVWGEEDEENFNQLHKLIVKKAYEEYEIDTEDETLWGKHAILDNWLKSLKERIKGGY